MSTRVLPSSRDVERRIVTSPYREVADFVSLLRLRASEMPTKVAFQWLIDGEIVGPSHTYASLHDRARRIASGLRERGLSGARALIVQSAGHAFVETFFGCLYAGVTAVPLCPLRPRESAGRIVAVARDASSTTILTTSAMHDDLTRRVADAAGDGASRGDAIDVLAIDDLAIDDLTIDRGFTGDARQRIGPRDADGSSEHADAPAFLQYTSGSTGQPKGVVLSHRHLLHNGEMLRLGFDHGVRTRIVSWLPLFHDMGLIGQVLQAVYCGGTCILMSPQAFVSRPSRWLRAISDYRATTSGAPNFAYQLCVDRVFDDEMDGVDLSRWRVAFNGAEPVRAETMQRFAERFAAAGFRRRAFYPCYGLAEATLFSTGGCTATPPGALTICRDALAEGRVVATDDDPSARTVVSCGRTRLDQSVLIVDPASGAPCASDRVGEIWLRSGSVARGYWGNERESERTFGALPVAPEGSSRPYLRTGDLGFLHAGELYVTGRLKDVIIIAGRNHYPHDIESTVGESHVAFRAGHAAAFSVEAGGEERLVVVQEVERTALREVTVAQWSAAARAAVLRDHDVRLQSPIFVKPGTVPRTSSGKIRRRECRARYVRGELKPIDSTASRTQALSTGAGGEVAT